MWDALMSFFSSVLILLCTMLCIACSPTPFILRQLDLGGSLISHPIQDLHMPSCNSVFMARIFRFVSTFYRSRCSLWQIGAYNGTLLYLVGWARVMHDLLTS